MANDISVVKKMTIVRKLGMTLIRFGIIPQYMEVPHPTINLGPGVVQNFALRFCKEYVDRYTENKWFPEQRDT